MRIAINNEEAIILYTLLDEELKDNKNRLIKMRILTINGERSKSKKWLMPHEQSLLDERESMIRMFDLLSQKINWDLNNER